MVADLLIALIYVLTLEDNQHLICMKAKGCMVKIRCTRGNQKIRGKVLLNRIAFIDCNENS